MSDDGAFWEDMRQEALTDSLGQGLCGIGSRHAWFPTTRRCLKCGAAL